MEISMKKLNEFCDDVKSGTTQIWEVIKPYKSKLDDQHFVLVRVCLAKIEMACNKLCLEYRKCGRMDEFEKSEKIIQTKYE